MHHYHAEAVRIRERVSIVHNSSFHIHTRTSFSSLDEAIRALGLWRAEWHQIKAVVRFHYPSRTLRGFDIDFHVVILDYLDRVINPDIVWQRVNELKDIRSPNYYGYFRASYDPSRFRRGPVPHTSRCRRGGFFRCPETYAERRDAAAVYVDEDCVEYGIVPRASRNHHNLPSNYDDIGRSDYDNSGWKRHRRHQWKVKP